MAAPTVRSESTLNGRAPKADRPTPPTRSPQGSTAVGFSPRGRLTLGIAAAVVLGLLAFTIGLAVGRPDNPGENSADAGFARDMSTHHAQAVELGMIAFHEATLPAVRTLGGDIALTQQAQIGMMQTWLKQWGLPPSSNAEPMAWVPGGDSMVRGNLMPGMATREEVQKLQDATGSDVDILFLQYMLRHHLGGIHMVDELLLQNPTPQVRELADTMKTGQTSEVGALQELLAQLGASPIN